MTTIRLRLFVTGQTVSARRARAALTELEDRILAERGPGTVVSEVIDVLATPEIAARDDIFATPTIVRLAPAPSLRVFGDLASAGQLMTNLELGASMPPVADQATSGEYAASWHATGPDTSSSPAAVPD